MEGLTMSDVTGWKADVTREDLSILEPPSSIGLKDSGRWRALQNWQQGWESNPTAAIDVEAEDRGMRGKCA